MWIFFYKYWQNRNINYPMSVINYERMNEYCERQGNLRNGLPIKVQDTVCKKYIHLIKLNKSAIYSRRI